MNALTLVFGLAGIFTIISIVLFWNKAYEKGNIGKVFTTISTCIAVFFVFGACGIIPAKKEVARYHEFNIKLIIIPYYSELNIRYFLFLNLRKLLCYGESDEIMLNKISLNLNRKIMV